jgi:hypothetical protein
VIAEASHTRGGHAGAVYLQPLLEDRALYPVQIARLLNVAAHVVEVDAAMVDLLSAVQTFAAPSRTERNPGPCRLLPIVAHCKT